MLLYFFLVGFFTGAADGTPPDASGDQEGLKVFVSTMGKRLGTTATCGVVISAGEGSLTTAHPIRLTAVMIGVGASGVVALEVWVGTFVVIVSIFFPLVTSVTGAPDGTPSDFLRDA